KMTMDNSTISGNWSFLGVGGIGNTGSLTLKSSTVFGNRSRLNPDVGGIENSGQFVMSNSIVANSEGADVTGGYTDSGFNIVSDGSGITDPTSRSGDPKLGPLADNGGPTQTHALLAGSIAIDTGNCSDD